MTKFISMKSFIYALAVVVVAAGITIGSVVRADTTTAVSCYMTWLGFYISGDPGVCGSPPPGSAVYTGCTGPLGGFCPLDYAWTVYVTTPSCVATQGQSCNSSGTNACGMSGTGTIQCDGSCSATTPSDSLCTCSNGSRGPYPACPIGPLCAANATESCSFANSCGIINSGYVLCDGSCSVGSPAESLCSTYSQGSYYSQSSYYAQGSYAPGCTSPTVSITATPSRVRSGQTTTLTVTGTGITTSCTITGPGVNTTQSASSCGVSKTITTPAITANSIYNVSCDSGAATGKVIVNIPFGVVEF